MRNRRNRGRGSRQIIETFTFSTQQGTTAVIKRSTITSLPARCNWRPVWFEVEVCGFQPGTNTLPGYLAPVGCQIGFRNESDGTYCSTSRLIITGANPMRLRTYYPPSADWHAYNASPDTSLADINAVCVGTHAADVPGFLRGIGRMAFKVQEENCAVGCPSLSVVSHVSSAPAAPDASGLEISRPSSPPTSASSFDSLS